MITTNNKTSKKQLLTSINLYFKNKSVFESYFKNYQYLKKHGNAQNSIISKGMNIFSKN